MWAGTMDNKEFHFVLISDAGSNMEGAAVFIQDQFRRVGVKMEIQTLERSVVEQRVRAGNFEAAVKAILTDPESLQKVFGQDSPLGYRNAQVIELVNKGVATANPEEQNQIYRELSKIIKAELPVTFLYPLVVTSATIRKIKGLDNAALLFNMEHLWIENEK
jgi:ABC-type transport system substrate-binding protein